MGGPKPIRLEAVAKALALVRTVIERLRATYIAGGPQTTAHEFGFVGPLGEVSIAGEDARHYRSALDALLALHGPRAERRLLSRRTVERLLIDALLRTLRPGREGFRDPRPRFEGRMKKELRRLKAGLLVPLRHFQIAVQVTGLENRILPLKLGRIHFHRGTKELAQSVTSIIFDYQPGSSRKPLKKEVYEGRHRKTSREGITSMLSTDAVALAEVSAADQSAAKEIGLAEVRRSIDVLNYFARFFEHPVGLHRAYVTPEAAGRRLGWVVYNPNTWAFSMSDGTRQEWDLRVLKTSTKLAKRVGLARAHELLGDETRSDLGDRILTAIVWAGRARVTKRREEAFLLYAIALEALLT